MIRPYAYLRLVLDPVRLAVLGRAAGDPVDPDALARELGVSKRKVLGAVGRLREAGLLTADLRLDVDALRELAEAMSEATDEEPDVREGLWSPEERKILGRFFRGRELTEIPAARSKRRVVLERIAQEFEPGVQYGEPEVNGIIHLFHPDKSSTSSYPDHATLRRYLVDEGFLSRKENVYWRTGGRVPDQ